MFISSIAYFNPTLVQLEAIPATETLLKEYIFQSHIGAIRRKIREGENEKQMHFNPTLVQLEEGRKPLATTIRSRISIPHWCN